MGKRSLSLCLTGYVINWAARVLMRRRRVQSHWLHIDCVRNQECIMGLLINTIFIFYFVAGVQNSQKSQRGNKWFFSWILFVTCKLPINQRLLKLIWIFLKIFYIRYWNQLGLFRYWTQTLYRVLHSASSWLVVHLWVVLLAQNRSDQFRWIVKIINHSIKHIIQVTIWQSDLRSVRSG